MEIKCMKCGSVRLYAQTEAIRESFQVNGAWVEKGYLNTAGKAHVFCLECYDEWRMNINVVPTSRSEHEKLCAAMKLIETMLKRPRHKDNRSLQLVYKILEGLRKKQEAIIYKKEG